MLGVFDPKSQCLLFVSQPRKMKLSFLKGNIVYKEAYWECIMTLCNSKKFLCTLLFQYNCIKVIYSHSFVLQHFVSWASLENIGNWDKYHGTSRVEVHSGCFDLPRTHALAWMRAVTLDSISFAAQWSYRLETFCRNFAQLDGFRRGHIQVPLIGHPYVKPSHAG